METETPDEESPLPAPAWVLYLAGTVSFLFFAAGGLQLLFAVICLSNFDFERPTHLAVFVVNLLAPLGVLVSGIYFQVRPGILSAAWMVASYAGVGLAWYLWTIPAAKGLLH